MSIKQALVIVRLISAVSLLVGCVSTPRSAGSTAVPTVAPAASASAPVSTPTGVAATLTVTPGGAPAEAPATAAPSTSAPQAGATPAVSPDPGPAYLDDRSTATALLDSFYNAINRREYARAYSYWQPGADQLQPYAAFEQGYSATRSVQLSYGPVTGDVGAGQTRYSVPVAITSQTSGGTEHFAGCYVLHLASPAAQGTLPFRPLAIESAAVESVSSPPSPDALAQACAVQGSPVPTPAPTDAIDSSVYLDSRTDPVSVVRSFYNAINRREYVRAYSYWQDQSQIPLLPAFTAGYSSTQTVALTTGTVITDIGAGQRNYGVPVMITSQMQDGSTQTYAGCYFLHLAGPAIQEPPYEPLGIVGADVQAVASGSSVEVLMRERCRFIR